MRQLASFLLIALALPAVAAETWRWKDENGVVHFSDRPVPGAERVVTPAAPESGATPGSTPQYSPRVAQPAEKPPYSECAVINPRDDQNFHGVHSVVVALQITPTLRPDHRVQVLFDNVAVAGWPQQALSFTLKEVYRGTHTVTAEVVDAKGKSLCSGPPVKFHVHQPSVLKKAAPPKKKP